MICPDLDCGVGSRFSAVNKGGKGENICFSKAGEGSCYFQSNLAADSSNHGHNSDPVSSFAFYKSGICGWFGLCS